MHNLLVLDDGTDRDRWLLARIPVITATQAAAIAGSHPYTKVIDVWNEKTDPNHDPDALRNRWLEERADLGNEREPAIIEWASEHVLTGGPGNPFRPCGALVANPERPNHAATPDAWKTARDENLVLLECKTTQQDWRTLGLPQHVYDQCIWQLYVTGAVTVWVAAEIYRWEGKGKARQAVEIDRVLFNVQPDPKRLQFLLDKVAEFEGWLRDGIAPESDIDLTAAPVIDWDDDAETAAAKLAEWEELHLLEEAMAELAEIRERIAADERRAEDLETVIKGGIKVFAGRRVHLIGSRLVAKLVRGTRVERDWKALPEKSLREITTWKETETVRIEPNPTYTSTTEPTERGNQ